MNDQSRQTLINNTVVEIEKMSEDFDRLIGELRYSGGRITTIHALLAQIDSEFQFIRNMVLNCNL